MIPARGPQTVFYVHLMGASMYILWVQVLNCVCLIVCLIVCVSDCVSGSVCL